MGELIISQSPLSPKRAGEAGEEEKPGENTSPAQKGSLLPLNLFMGFASPAPPAFFCHLSPITYHLSPITYHLSPITSPAHILHEI